MHKFIFIIVLEDSEQKKKKVRRSWRTKSLIMDTEEHKKQSTVRQTNTLKDTFHNY